jgi:hypothetical protein
MEKPALKDRVFALSLGAVFIACVGGLLYGASFGSVGSILGIALLLFVAFR